MTRKPYQQGRVFIGRLPGGADVVAAATRVANEEGIKVGVVAVHGVLARASFVVHDADAPAGRPFEIESMAEIASLSGTISQFKGRSMARLSGLVVTTDGRTTGGTVGLGTIVHACEMVITEMLGGTLTRDFDVETGLPLWKENAMLIERPGSA